MNIKFHSTCISVSIFRYAFHLWGADEVFPEGGAVPPAHHQEGVCEGHCRGALLVHQGQHQRQGTAGEEGTALGTKCILYE